MNHSYPGRYLTGLVFGLLSSAVVFFSTYGDLAEFTAAIVAGILLAISVYSLVGGTVEELKGNIDRKGRKYSWKNTLSGITVFVVSIPFVIWLTLHLFGYL